MRTTVTLDPDVVAEIERLRREDGLGVSEALNRLVRERMAQTQRPRAYAHRGHDLGIKIDISNIGEVLELLDES